MSSESFVYLNRQSDNMSGFELSTPLKYKLNNRKKVCEMTYENCAVLNDTLI